MKAQSSWGITRSFRQTVTERRLQELGSRCADPHREIVLARCQCLILPGVQLGDHVIVGAGSVVTKSFPADCIIAGVPARIIKQRSPNERGLFISLPLVILFNAPGVCVCMMD